MISDAISHAILPGIVIAFFITRDLNSPLLLAAAAATGVLTVVLLLFAVLAVTFESLTMPLLVLLYALSGEPVPRELPQRAALSIVYLGVVGSVLGFVLYYYVLRHVEATRVALIALISPVLALLLGKLLNGEELQAGVLLGAAAILGGLLLFEYGEAAGRRVRDSLPG